MEKMCVKRAPAWRISDLGTGEQRIFFKLRYFDMDISLTIVICKRYISHRGNFEDMFYVDFKFSGRISKIGCYSDQTLLS